MLVGGDTDEELIQARVSKALDAESPEARPRLSSTSRALERARQKTQATPPRTTERL